MKLEKEIDNSLSLSCIYCKSNFKNENDAVHHIVSKHGKCKFQCPYCVRHRFSDQFYIEKHFDEFHLGKNFKFLNCDRLPCFRYRCIFCEYSADHESIIEKHLYGSHPHLDNLYVSLRDGKEVFKKLTKNKYKTNS